MRTCRAPSRQGTRPHTTVSTPCRQGSCPQPPPTAPLCLTGSSPQAGRLHPAPRTPTPRRAATTMTSRALAAEDGDGQHWAVGRGLRALRGTHDHAAYISLGLLQLPPPCWGTGRGAGARGGTLGAGCARLRASIKGFSQLVTVSLGRGDGCSAAPQRGRVPSPRSSPSWATFLGMCYPPWPAQPTGSPQRSPWGPQAPQTPALTGKPSSPTLPGAPTCRSGKFVPRHILQLFTEPSGSVSPEQRGHAATTEEAPK